MEENSATATARTSDVDSLSTTGDYEQNRERARVSNPRGFSSRQSGVDVEKAEYEFAELNRELTNISQQARRLSKQASTSSKAPAATDLEKSGSSADFEEPWNLETTLRGNRAAEIEAGIKNKHIGMLLCRLNALAHTLYRCNMGKPHCPWYWGCEDLHQDIP